MDPNVYNVSFSMTDPLLKPQHLRQLLLSTEQYYYLFDSHSHIIIALLWSAPAEQAGYYLATVSVRECKQVDVCALKKVFMRTHKKYKNYDVPGNI